MKPLLALLICGCALLFAQERDWSFYGGDAQRTGWAKSDIRITKDNVGKFQLVLKRKFEMKQKGPRSLTPPVVIGRLISYRGFKELAFVAGSSGDLWSIDADMDRIFWQKHLESDKSKPASSSPLCSGSVTATPSLTPPMNFAARGPRTPGAPAPAARPEGKAPAGRGILGAGGFGAPRPAFAVSSDGKLHLLNTSNGDEVVPPMNFLPANAKASNLTVSDGALYTTTTGGCGGAPDAVWSIDLSGDPQATPPVTSFPLSGGAVSELGGFAIGTDGTVYVQTSGGPLLALTSKELKLKQDFTGPEGGAATTPVIFTFKDRDLIVSAGKDRRLYLLDSQALGGEDHKTPLYQTAALTTSGHGVWGGLSSWQDADGTRWVLAPVWGPVSAEFKAFATNGPAATGSIVAFKVEEKDGKPVLTPAWVSHDMNSPEPPVITSGIVFALASGGHATLLALDGATGKELYSTGTQVTAPATLAGMTLANGRVYFTTTDNTLYAFGIYMER